MHFLIPWTYHLFLSMKNVDSSFLKLPQCLCIHLQRLSWSNQGTPLKRHEHVQFNEFLVMDIYKYRVPGPKSSQEPLSQKSSEETSPGIKDGRAGKPSGTSFANKTVQLFLHLKGHSLQDQAMRSTWTEIPLLFPNLQFSLGNFILILLNTYFF